MSKQEKWQAFDYSEKWIWKAAEHINAADARIAELEAEIDELKAALTISQGETEPEPEPDDPGPVPEWFAEAILQKFPDTDDQTISEDWQNIVGDVAREAMRQAKGGE